MRLTLKKEKIPEIVNALDFYSRIWIGQFDHLLWELRYIKDYKGLDAKDNDFRRELLSIRNEFLPELIGYGFTGSYGIFNKNRDYRAGVAYDLQQEIRYKRAWGKDPEGGWTVDFRRPLWCEDDPYQKNGGKRGGTPYAEYKNGEIVLNIVPEQKQTIDDALQVWKDLQNIELTKMFSYYTDDPKLLHKIQHFEKEVKAIPDATWGKKIEK